MGIVGASILSPFHKSSAKSYSRIIGSNDRITLAFQGLGRRFPGLLNSSLEMKNVEIKYFCDVMDQQIDKANKRYFNLTIRKPIQKKIFIKLLMTKMLML